MFLLSGDLNRRGNAKADLWSKIAASTSRDGTATLVLSAELESPGGE